MGTSTGGFTAPCGAVDTIINEIRHHRRTAEDARRQDRRDISWLDRHDVVVRRIAAEAEAEAEERGLLLALGILLNGEDDPEANVQESVQHCHRTPTLPAGLRPTTSSSPAKESLPSPNEPPTSRPPPPPRRRRPGNGRPRRLPQWRPGR